MGLVPTSQHYYGGSDFCQELQRISPTIAVSFSFRPDRWSREPGTFVPAFLTCYLTIDSQLSLTWQLSLLISIELLNIPSPTTLLPFHQPRFPTLPVYFTVLVATLTDHRSGQTLGVFIGTFVRSKVRAILGHSPTGLAESSSHDITDCSFTSSCSPPCLAATQLPLVTGW